MIENFNSETPTLLKSTVLGIAEGVTTLMQTQTNPRSCKRKETRPCTRNCCEIHWIMSQEEMQILVPVLLKYARVFHDGKTSYFKGTDII